MNGVIDSLLSNPLYKLLKINSIPIIAEESKLFTKGIFNFRNNFCYSLHYFKNKCLVMNIFYIFIICKYKILIDSWSALEKRLN